MRAEINKDGYVHLIAETPTEAFAIKGMEQQAKDRSDAVASDRPYEFPLLINLTILSRQV